MLYFLGPIYTFGALHEMSQLRQREALIQQGHRKTEMFAKQQPHRAKWLKYTALAVCHKKLSMFKSNT